ncbi:MAG TPA: hypothetical protein VI756_17405 [Blastocatellia bacterium]
MILLFNNPDTPPWPQFFVTRVIGSEDLPDVEILTLPAHQSADAITDPVELQRQIMTPEGEDFETVGGSGIHGGALPERRIPGPVLPRRIRCLEGDIEYFVEGAEPRLVYRSPQRFTFITQGDGLVRVNGPGTDRMLARRYKPSR